MSSHIHRSHESVSGGFTETASDYEDAVRFNIEGAQRLVLSIPPGCTTTSSTSGAAPGGRRRP